MLCERMTLSDLLLVVVVVVVFAAVSFVACLFVFNRAVDVVIIRLRVWCTLGVFSVAGITRLRHERQGFVSSCDGVHAYTD